VYGDAGPPIVAADQFARTLSPKVPRHAAVVERLENLLADTFNIRDHDGLSFPEETIIWCDFVTLAI
jgi:hypothetical protein